MRDCGLWAEAKVPGENVERTYKLHSKKIPGLNSHVTGAFSEVAALTTNKSHLSFYARPPPPKKDYSYPKRLFMPNVKTHSW